MARAKSNGGIRLEEAMALLIQNQAAFLARASEIDARVADSDVSSKELRRENTERFAHIEAILLEHSRVLAALPEAVRERMGFRPPS